LAQGFRLVPCAAALCTPALFSQMEDLQTIYEAERQELLRSERVASQLSDVLNTLRKRGKDLAAESDRLLAQERGASFEALQQELEQRCSECEAAEVERAASERGTAETRQLVEASEALAAERAAAASEAEARAEELERERRAADARREEASAAARSMVSAEVLERVTQEAEDLRQRLQVQEDEAGKLRQALIDSWASRSCVDPFEPEPQQRRLSSPEELDNVEEQLQWLTRMQQESSAEVQRLQSLEKREARLQARLRELSEEKAQLQSARVDLGNAGSTMREAIAAQSDKWVRTVDDLERKRLSTDQDRQKLMTECANLQARLDVIRPELESVVEVESEHGRAQAQRSRCVNESHSLQNINAALTFMLLGGDSPPAMPGEEGDPICSSEALTRVLQLYKRLKERSEGQAHEKEKLVDRLRELERQAARPDEAPAAAKSLSQPPRGGSGGARKTATPAPAANPLEAATASASKALKGGLGKLRGFADGVL